MLKRTVFVLISSTLACVALSGCDKKIDKLQSQLDEFNRNLNELQKNATDVGVISEIGWISKMLRDSATGTPAEQAKAKADAARLFGVDPAELAGGQFFEVTLQFTGFTPGQDLAIDTKYVPDDTVATIKSIFARSSGNQWNPNTVTAPQATVRSEAQIRELTKKRLGGLLSKLECRSTGDYRNRSGNCKSSFGEYLTGWGAYTGNNEQKAKDTIASQRESFVNGLTEAVLTPLEIAGLPSAGWSNGVAPVAWGLTSGASPYITVLVPKKQVELHPTLEIRAWLHPKGRPDIFLGKGYPIHAVDFVTRCLGRIDYPNPTPQVDSKTSAGPLCWYSFDLFGAGALSRLSELAREANESKPK